MLDGVIPVVVAENHFPGDQLDFFGLNAETDTFAAFGPGAVHLYIELIAPADLEVLIWDVQATVLNNGVPDELPVHLFTPLQDFALLGGATNPLIPNPVLPFLYFPWLQPVSQPESGRLSQTLSQAGATSGLQVVSVNGIPTTSIGPIRNSQAVAGSALFFGGLLWNRFYSSSYRPPLRLKPETRVAVQTTVADTRGLALGANFIYSERPYEPGR